MYTLRLASRSLLQNSRPSPNAIGLGREVPRHSPRLAGTRMVKSPDGKQGFTSTLKTEATPLREPRVRKQTTLAKLNPSKEILERQAGGAGSKKLRWAGITASAVVGISALQLTGGHEDNYYEYRFTTDKDPDDLATFYGSEDFMDLFCVMPFVGTLMMRGGDFDDEGGFHTTGFPGTLSVNMVFSDEQNPQTGDIIWFNKRERFRDTLCDHVMWDTVMNFGFRSLPNGKIECYHTGEYFKGSSPPVSLAVKWLFQLHARWVAWATEHHLNHHAFTAETPCDEALEECSRKDMPLHLLRDHFLTDLKAWVMGADDKPEPQARIADESAINKEQEGQASSPNASFLTKKRQRRSENTANRARAQEALFNSRSIKQQIKADIEHDKRAHQKVEIVQDSVGYRNLGGNQAWELLRSTNNPEVYQKVTRAALQRKQTRRKP